MTVTWSWDLQAYISGAWTSVAADVLCHTRPIVASRGISGSDITNRVASPGSLSAFLDNGQSNSAGLLGYYAPGHANMRSGFGRKTDIRLKITYGGTDYYKWKGYVTDLEPNPNQFGSRESQLSATDFMQRMIEHKLNLVPVQEDQRSDQLMQTILDNMSNAPTNTDIETGKFTVPFALHNEQDERTTAMGATQKVCQSFLAYAYVRGNTTDGETFVLQSEAARAAQVAVASFDNTMSDLKVNRNVDNQKNRLVGTVHPVQVDDEATTLLYELQSEIPLDGGDTQNLTFKFSDPQNKATRISATEVVTALVADTHYRMSSISRNNGNDKNSALSINNIDIGANAFNADFENTSGSRGYINLINIFGKGIYLYSPLEIVVESGAGDKAASYDFYYLSDPYRARGFLSALHFRTSSDETEAESIMFYADANSTLMGYAMTYDIGDRFLAVEAATGLAREFTINKVTYTIMTNGTLKVEWFPEPADSHSYFILDVSLLDDTDVLSPY